MEIGYILKFLRKEARKTQKQLADELGVGQATISQWEKGISKPTADAIIALSGYYCVSADFILGISDKKEGDAQLDSEVEECIALLDNLTSKQRGLIKGIIKEMKPF